MDLILKRVVRDDLTKREIFEWREGEKSPNSRGKSTPLGGNSKWKDPEVGMTQCMPGNAGSKWLEQSTNGRGTGNQRSHNLGGKDFGFYPEGGTGRFSTEK